MARNQGLRLPATAFVVFFLLPLFAGCSESDPAATAVAGDPGVAERTAPVGQVAVEAGDANGTERQGAFQTVPEGSTVVAAEDKGSATAGTAANGPGKKTFDEACAVCHATGAAGAPKFGDAEAWAARIAQGVETLYNHAINGFQGKSGIMPPKGGRVDLDDDAIKAAVDYMVAKSK